MPSSTDEFRKKVNQLPPTLKETMISYKTTEILSVIYEKYKLSPDQRGKTSYIIGKIITKEILLADFLNTLKAQINFDFKILKSLVTDIIRALFLPLKRHFPGVEEILENLKPEQKTPTTPNIVNLKNK
jgi:hypothetical protein